MKLMRWHVEVTGWRYTRRWVIGIRGGEWWIGARRNFACDWWEIGLFGLTICIPDDGAPRRSVKLPAHVFHGTWTGVSGFIADDGLAPPWQPPAGINALLGLPTVTDADVPPGQAILTRHGNTLMIRARNTRFTFTAEQQTQIRDHFDEGTRRAADAMRWFEDFMSSITVSDQLPDGVSAIVTSPGDPHDPVDSLARRSAVIRE